MSEEPQFRPGIIYGHRELESKGLRAAPIVLLTRPTDDQLYASQGGIMPGRPLYTHVAKPKGGRRPPRGFGWPAVGIYNGSPRTAEDLLSLTLEDFLAVNEPRAGGFRFILVTHLSHIRGPYGQVAQAEQRTFEEKQQKRAEQERASRALKRLAANGIRIDRVGRRFNGREVEAIADLVDGFGDPGR